MLAGSLASSPYMAYTATEYSVLGDSPSSRTSGWATFTCQQRDILEHPSVLGYLPTLATEQDLTETRAKVPWVTLRGILHFGTSPLGSVVYSSQRSASLPKGHRARLRGTHHLLLPWSAEAYVSYTKMLLLFLFWGWISGHVKDVIPLCSDTWKTLAEELPVDPEQPACCHLPLTQHSHSSPPAACSLQKWAPETFRSLHAMENSLIKGWEHFNAGFVDIP